MLGESKVTTTKKPTAKQGLKHAEEFLKAIKKALKHAEAIEATVEEYQQVEGDGYPDDPPLLKANSEWIVPKKKIEGFRSLMNFFRRAIFGVDCDSDNAVFFSICDRTREENFLPTCHVPRVDWEDASLYKRYDQLRKARLIVSSAQGRVDIMERCLDEDLQKIIRKDDRLRKAKNCPTCRGKGWIESDQETWEALDYGAKCRTGEFGCKWRHWDGKNNRGKGPYRLFCECQEDEEGD